MKTIELTQNKFALVDDGDYYFYSNWNWQYANGYAIRFERHGKTRKTIYLHREILNSPMNLDVDHINRNRLDSRRGNLRIATRSNNMANSPKPKNNTSGYKGVVWRKRKEKWEVKITYNYKKFYLGEFKCLEDAAKAYDKAAIINFGEFATLNFPEN